MQRRVELFAESFLHDHDFVTVDDGDDSMRDCENRAIFESFADFCLYHFIGFHIYVGGSFIQY